MWAVMMMMTGSDDVEGLHEEQIGEPIAKGLSPVDGSSAVIVVVENGSASSPDGLNQGTCLIHVTDKIIVMVCAPLLGELSHEGIFRHAAGQREREDNGTIKVGHW